MAGTPASSVRGGFPLGLVGATAATRYVGGTASGSPVSGTFSKGDFVIDQTGTLYICTVAGTPGTWATPGAASALDYAQVTANLTVTATTSPAAQTFVSGAAIAYDGLTSIKVDVYCAAGEITALNALVFALWQDATELGTIAQVQANNAANTIIEGCVGSRIYTPAAGTKTHILKCWKTGGTATAYASAGGAGANLPAFIRITRA